MGVKLGFDFLENLFDQSTEKRDIWTNCLVDIFYIHSATFQVWIVTDKEKLC